MRKPASNARKLTPAQRAKLRRRAMKPIKTRVREGGRSRMVEIWVPDIRSPRFKAEARRQSRVLAADPNFEADMKWIEAATRDLWRDLPDY